MEKVKLVAVNGFVYSRKAVDAGEPFSATPVDAEYLVSTGQATREDASSNGAGDDYTFARDDTYSRRDMVADQPSDDAPDEAPKRAPAKRVAAKRVAESPKRKYTRRNLTAEGADE